MFKSLRRKPVEETSTQAPPIHLESVKTGSSGFAPDTEISFHPDLITRFTGHHASLLKLFETVKTKATNNAFADAQKALQSFRSVLTTHLLEENIKLYTYLSKCLSDDPDSRDLVVSMKAEMGKIGTEVMRFLNEYTTAGLTPFNKHQFLNELESIGATLVERIEREEASLYTMYMPPSAFHRT